MVESRKFDSKTFLRRTYDTRTDRNLLNQAESQTKSNPRKADTMSSALKRPISRVLFKIVGQIVKPFSYKFRKHLVGNIESEINYFHSRQTKMNQEILEELREIRVLLEARRNDE